MSSTLDAARRSAGALDDLTVAALADAVDLLEIAAAADDTAAMLAELTTIAVEDLGAIAGELAADYYDEARAAAGVPGQHRATIAAVDLGEVDAAARWAAGPLYDVALGAPTYRYEYARRLYLETVDRLIRGAYRETIATAAASDPSAASVVRVARPDACYWCLLMATDPSKVPDGGYHRNCKCHPVPTWSAGFDDLPDPADLYRDYKQVTADAARDGVHPVRAWREHIEAKRGR